MVRGNKSEAFLLGPWSIAHVNIIKNNKKKSTVKSKQCVYLHEVIYTGLQRGFCSSAG